MLAGTHLALAICVWVCKALPPACGSPAPELVSVCRRLARKRAPGETHSIFFL